MAITRKKLALPSTAGAALLRRLGDRVSARAFLVSLGLQLAAAAILFPQISGGKPEGPAAHQAAPLFTGKVMAEVELVQQADEPIHHEAAAAGTAATTATEHHPAPDETAPHTETPPENTPPAEGPRPQTELVESLFEQTSFGPVPIIRKSDGHSVFKEYAVPFIPQADTRGIIALVMTDYGLSDSVAAKSLTDLPAHTTFVISPYTRQLQDRITDARSAGFEIWLDCPIQTSGFGTDDTGPLTLLSGLNDDQNQARLYQILSLSYGYAGLAFSTPPAFSQNKTGYDSILATLERRGIGLAHLSGKDVATNKLTDEVAAAHPALPYFGAPAIISADTGHDNVRASLNALTQTARDHFYAVAVIRPQPALFPLLKEWAASLKDSGVQIVPLSAVVSRATPQHKTEEQKTTLPKE